MPSDECPRDHDSKRIHETRPMTSLPVGWPTVFQPNRRRVFKRLSVTLFVVFLCYVAIYYGALGQRDWNGVYPFFFGLASVAYSTWLMPTAGAVSVSDSVISGPSGRTMRLDDLDRVRSMKRSLWDRVNGRQCLYPTSGRRISFWRASFDPSDLRRLLDLLQLDQAKPS